MISKLKLLKGSPIDIGTCKVYPLKLDEIVDGVGEFKYNQYLSALMVDKSTLNPDAAVAPEEKEQFNQLTSYEILIIHARHDQAIREIITDSLSLFLRERINYHVDGFFYFGKIIEDRPLLKEDFEMIKIILQKQNYLQDKKEQKEFKPANDKAAELLEKMKQAKEKLQKQNNEDGLNLSDVISIVSTYSQDINILSVWNLTIYQLYEIYLRLIMWDEYHNNFILLPHVYDNKSLNLKHWATKINYTNNNN